MSIFDRDSDALRDVIGPSAKGMYTCSFVRWLGNVDGVRADIDGRTCPLAARLLRSRPAAVVEVVV